MAAQPSLWRCDLLAMNLNTGHDHIIAIWFKDTSFFFPFFLTQDMNIIWQLDRNMVYSDHFGICQLRNVSMTVTT